jgi:hypothetical protein
MAEYRKDPSLAEKIDQFEREQEQIRERMEEFRRECEQRFQEFRGWTASSGKVRYLENLKVLGLSPPVTRLEIRTAYLNLAKIHHPDAGGDAAAFRRINDAYKAVLARA